jgi:hypothetical protein
MKPTRILVFLAAAAVAGVSVFGVLVWRAVVVEEAAADEASRAFDEIRVALGSAPPIVEFSPDGRARRVREPPAGGAAGVTTLRALAYQAGPRRLVRAEVPFWFVKLKGPAARVALRGTGLDLDRLGLTAPELERYGPGLVLDERLAGGDRLLVWIE